MKLEHDDLTDGYQTGITRVKDNRMNEALLPFNSCAYVYQ